MARKIRISVEVNYAGINIPNEYEDLPDDWDDMSAKEQDAYLSDLAMEALSLVAGAGACVVDEDDNPVD